MKYLIRGGLLLLLLVLLVIAPPPASAQTEGSFITLRLGTAPNRARDSVGLGSPEGVVTGGVGDRYVQVNGLADNIVWTKESGDETTTGWKISAAPKGATYLLQTANSLLPNAQAMGALGTGIVLNTTTTGVQSIFTGTSCTNQVLRVLSASGAGTCITITSSYVDGSLALTGNPLSQFAATTSAQLASVLSDETGGAGVAVFSASPALTGTPTVPTAAPGTNTTQVASTAFVASAVATAAPTDASYLTQIPNATLTNEQAMSTLGTGLVRNTTTTGVQSIFAGTSCTNQFPRALDASGAATCETVSLTADVTGTLPIGNGGTGNTAGAATVSAVTDDPTTNATMYPAWVPAASGNQALKVSSTKLSFNPSTSLFTLNHSGTTAHPVINIHPITAVTNQVRDLYMGTDGFGSWISNAAFDDTNYKEYIYFFRGAISGSLTYAANNSHAFIVHPTDDFSGFSSNVLVIGDSSGLNSGFKIKEARALTFSAGSSTYNTVGIFPTINTTGGSNTIRGVYYNPTLTSITGTTHIAWENATGNVLFGTTSGRVGVGTNAPGSALTVNGGIALATTTTGAGDLVMSNAVPTINSAFGASPSVTAGHVVAFRVNVGTGGLATGGVLATGATATTGWNCSVTNLTAVAANRADQHTVQTASTTTTVTVQNQTVSTGAALAWTASDILTLICVGF